MYSPAVGRVEENITVLCGEKGKYGVGKTALIVRFVGFLYFVGFWV